MNTFMRKRLTPTLFALLLAASPALAEFEGVLEMKMTTSTKDGEGGGGGTLNIAVSKPGTRCEMKMEMGGMGMNIVVLQKNDTPDILYHLNDAEKTYSEIDLAKMREMGAQHQNTRTYKVEKLGQETLLGYKTQHVRVKETSASGDDTVTTELWTAPDLLSFESFSKMQMRRGGAEGGAALFKALKDSGADGLPLKSITPAGGGATVTMEATKVQKKSLPAAMFEIPAGYSKSAGGMMGGMGGMSGPQAEEAKRRMQEAMKNMTPEQRKQIEEMMKQRNAGGQP
jgi:hypothetical protein